MHISRLASLCFLLASLSLPALSVEYKKMTNKEKSALFAEVKEELPDTLKGKISAKSIKGRELLFPRRFVIARNASTLVCLDEENKEIIVVTPLTPQQKKELMGSVKEASNLKLIPRDYLNQIHPDSMFSQEEARKTLPIAYQDFSEDYLVYATDDHYISLHHVPTESGDVVTELAIRCTKPSTTNVMQLGAAGGSADYFPISKDIESDLHRELQWDLMGQLSRLLSDRLASNMYLCGLNKESWKQGWYAGRFLPLPLTLPVKEQKGDAPTENILSGMDKLLEASFGRHYLGLSTLVTQYPDTYFKVADPEEAADADRGSFQPLQLIIPGLEEEFIAPTAPIYYIPTRGENFKEVASRALVLQAEHIKRELKQLQSDYARFLKDHSIQQPVAAQLAQDWKLSLDTYVESIIGEEGSLDRELAKALEELEAPEDPKAKKHHQSPVYELGADLQKK